MNPRAAANQLQQTAAPGMDVAHVMPHEVAQMKAQGAAVTRNPATGVVQMVMPQEKEVLRMNPAIANLVAGSGRNGDSQVAETSPGVRQQLKGRGGAGTRNPKTGKREYYTFDSMDDSLSGAGVDTGTGTTGTGTTDTGTTTTPTGNDPARATPINIDTSAIASPVQDRTTGTPTSGGTTVNATATPTTPAATTVTNTSTATPTVNATATPAPTTPTPNNTVAGPGNAYTSGKTQAQLEEELADTAFQSGNLTNVNTGRAATRDEILAALRQSGGLASGVHAAGLYRPDEMTAVNSAYQNQLGRNADPIGAQAQLERARAGGVWGGDPKGEGLLIEQYLTGSAEANTHRQDQVLNAIRNLSSAQTAPAAQAQAAPQIIYQNGQPQIVYLPTPSTQGQNMIAGTAAAPYNSLTPRRMARGRSSRYAGAPAMQFSV